MAHSTRVSAVWLLVGFGLMQVAWMAALPPFRGADEVDHVFRASAVAHGEWVSEPTDATIGTGAVVSVSTAIVEAARPACERLGYKAADDCGPPAPDTDRVDVPTASGRYNPTYYALVGYPSTVRDGTAAVVLMRVISAGMCLALLAFGLVRLAAWGGPRRLLAVGIGAAPTVVYSATVVAPNGLEMMAALGFWIALAGLAHDHEPRRENGHVVLGVVAGALLVTLRSMGPFWALAILSVSLLAWPGLFPRLRNLVRKPQGKVAVAVGLVAGVASLTWILVQRSLVVGLEPEGGTVSITFRFLRTLQELPVWVLQAIAAFPFRNQPAPLVVYPCYLIVVGCLLVVGLRSADRRLRLAVLATVAVSLTVPLVITFATIDVFGTAWQGRYGLPLLLGAAVLAGDGWERAARRPPSMGVLGLGIALLLVVHTAGVASVAATMGREDAWTTGVGELPHAPAWAALALALTGAVAAFVPAAVQVRRPG